MFRVTEVVKRFVAENLLDVVFLEEGCYQRKGAGRGRD
jgi:hypothetical protein